MNFIVSKNSNIIIHFYSIIINSFWNLWRLTIKIHFNLLFFLPSAGYYRTSNFDWSNSKTSEAAFGSSVHLGGSAHKKNFLQWWSSRQKIDLDGVLKELGKSNEPTKLWPKTKPLPTELLVEIIYWSKLKLYV